MQSSKICLMFQVPSIFIYSCDRSILDLFLTLLRSRHASVRCSTPGSRVKMPALCQTTTKTLLASLLNLGLAQRPSFSQIVAAPTIKQAFLQSNASRLHLFLILPSAYNLNSWCKPSSFTISCFHPRNPIFYHCKLKWFPLELIFPSHTLKSLPLSLIPKFHFLKP